MRGYRAVSGIGGTGGGSVGHGRMDRWMDSPKELLYAGPGARALICMRTGAQGAKPMDRVVAYLVFCLFIWSVWEARSRGSEGVDPGAKKRQKKRESRTVT